MRRKEQKSKGKEKAIDNKVDEEETGKTFDILQLRISSKSFSKMAKILPPAHKARVASIGFEGLLYVDLPPFNAPLAKKIVNSFEFNSMRMMLPHGREIKVTPLDVHNVYNLPIGGAKVVEMEKEQELGWKEFLKEWRRSYGLTKGSPTLKLALHTLEKQLKSEPNEMFVWNFVVIAVNSCMGSNENPHLKYKFLYSCLDIESIAQFDWCDYVHDQAMKSIKVWKTSVKKKFFTGPMPFLTVRQLISYFLSLKLYITNH